MQGRAPVQDDRTCRDAEWIARIRRDDYDAFAEMVQAYYSGLFDYALAYTRSPQAAEDLVQDILLAVWERRRGWAPHSTAKAYLFRAVRNRALNFLRDWKPFQGDTLPAADIEVAAGSSAENDLLYRDLLAGYHAAIAMMPERRRQVFRLSRLYGLTYEETAGVLGISINTVRTQMTAALKHLRAQLSRHL